MVEVGKKKTPTINRTIGSERVSKKGPKARQVKTNMNAKEGESRKSDNGPSHLVHDSDKVSEPSEITAEEKRDEAFDDNSGDLEKENKQGKEEEASDSGSSQDDTENAEDQKVERVTIIVSKSQNMNVDDQVVEEVNEIEILDENSSNDETEEQDGEAAALEQKIEEMEARIDKLEEELREVAALEISLYSVIAEHGSSAHKVHTPARRLSRLYIHACKHWTQDKRATIAKNTVSGLVLISKSCGNDVPRLTFWLTNTVVLRERISQAFGNTRQSSPLTRFAQSNGVRKRRNDPANVYVTFLEDWQETGTFIDALVKIESWIFSRIVESVWWQTLTPNMHSQGENASSKKSSGRLLGPALGDQKQGNYSINLWRNAFQDALQRLCPIRAAGHECGCLHELNRMVMEQCVARLDVAMFNAILRESAHEIPTDPISDPILDAKVLPIPAGDLSFGSGAQLKNSIGNWSRWLTEMFSLDADNSSQEQEDGDTEGGDGESKSFLLLNALSDLLMLPKDMLMNRSVRKEVCPSISLPLIKRILCNFTPDEFCPDPIPGAVLEALNAESIVESRLSGEVARNFPYTAAPVVYNPPSTSNVKEKSHLERNILAIERKGYTSDEELEEMDSPLSSIIDKLPSSPAFKAKGNSRHEEPSSDFVSPNSRYELLQEVWSV